MPIDLFSVARSWSEAARPASLATVIATDGSVPRHPGARMLIAADGDTVGTIGGGRVEQEVTVAGQQIASTNEPRVVSHHLVRDLAMCCGGSMHILIEPLARSADVFAAITDALAARRPITITSSLSSPLVVSEGLATAAPSWDGERFNEPRRPRERAILFGAGHVASALVPRLLAVDFEVVVCDDNEVGAADRARARFSADGAAIVESFEIVDVEKAIGSLGLGDFALILTRDHAIDQRLVEKLLPRTEMTYVGLIGSLGKVGRFRKRVIAKGIVDDAGWGQLEAPIGIDILAETPEEIAISIAADLIRRRARIRRGDD